MLTVMDVGSDLETIEVGFLTHIYLHDLINYVNASQCQGTGSLVFGERSPPTGHDRKVLKGTKCICITRLQWCIRKHLYIVDFLCFLLLFPLFLPFPSSPFPPTLAIGKRK